MTDSKKPTDHGAAPKNSVPNNKTISEEQLDSLLSELRFEADAASPNTALAARILAALPLPANETAARNDPRAAPGFIERITDWLGSPPRAAFAYAIPLLLGLYIGGVLQYPSAMELLETSNDYSADYPLDDQMLVLAGLTDELTDELSMGFASGSTQNK